MLMRLAAAIAGGLNPHQAGVLPVLHVAAKDAILDQHIAARLRAFIIYGDRPTPVLHGAVIDDGHPPSGNLFADAAAEDRSALAVKIAFQPMANRLMKHHARPAGAKNNLHLAGRGRDRGKVQRCDAQGLADLGLPDFRRHVAVEHHPAASAR